MGWFDDAVKSFNPLSAVGDIIGGAGNIIGAKMSADAAQWNTRKQLEWEREKFNKEIDLSNTAIQRRVKDLEEAGLNKIFATGEGANVPTAGSINPSMPDYSGIGRAAEMIGHGINTAFDVDLKRTQAKKLIENIIAEKQKKEAETASILDDMQPGRLKDQTIEKMKKERELAEAQISTEDYKQRNIAAQIAYQEIINAIKNKDLKWYEADKIINYILRIIPFAGMAGLAKGIGNKVTKEVAKQATKQAIKNKKNIPTTDKAGGRQQYIFTKDGVVDTRTGELLPTTLD